MSHDESIIELSEVSFQRDKRAILAGVSWRVRAGEHWAILGPNGSGKTTLLQMAMGYLWPTDGQVSVLGERFGHVDLRQLRRRVGYVSSALSPMIRGQQSALSIVISGAYASTGLFDKPSAATVRQATELLEHLGCDRIAASPFAVLSLGEQQKVLIARALMAQVELLILDEPCAGLDLRSRESLLSAIDTLARGPGAPRTPLEASRHRIHPRSLILVTHHIEEIPPAFTHALVLKAGKALAAGDKRDVVTGKVLSKAFDLPIEVQPEFGRYWARIKGKQ